MHVNSKQIRAKVENVRVSQWNYTLYKQDYTLWFAQVKKATNTLFLCILSQQPK